MSAVFIILLQALLLVSSYQIDLNEIHLQNFNISQEEKKIRKLQGSRYAMTLGLFDYIEYGDQVILGVHCGGSPIRLTSGNGWYGCNPYYGDTPCSTSLPVLCIKKVDAQQPSYKMKCHDVYYCGWSGGYLALSNFTKGTDLTSLDAGNRICAESHGSDYQMAEIHDGRGGWGFYGFAAKRKYLTRFWAWIYDQNANCWN